MYFPNAFRKTFLGKANSTALLTSTATAIQSLSAGMIGLYDKSWAAIDYTVEPTVVGQDAKPFYIVQGSYFTSDKIGTHGGYKESIKSKMINPRYISRIFSVAAKTPVQQVVQIPVTCGVDCDTTYNLRLDLKGSPALRFLSHNIYRTVDAYTGCCDATNPSYVKDAVGVLLQWKDKINTYPTIKDMVKARVYKWVYTHAASTVAAVGSGLSQYTLNSTSFTTGNGVALGQRVTGTGIPANSFVTTLTSGTSVVITYPTQTTAPTIGGTVSVKFYNDVYTEAGTTQYIPGTQTETGVGGSLVSGLGTSTGAASVSSPYTEEVAASSITTDAFIELTVAYMDTKFGSCTFTPTDKYELEPLKIYASITDLTGNPCNTTCFGTAMDSTHYKAGMATEVQAPVQAMGYGETVLRDLIQSGRYDQNHYPDSSHVDHLRMREIEADPAISAVSPTGYYNRLFILHNVPRFYNPTSTFDNDQYLVEIVYPNTITTGVINATDSIAAYVVAAANMAATGAPVGMISLESY